MKKFLLVALAGLFSLGVLNSCKKGEDTQKLTIIRGSICQTVFADANQGTDGVSFKTGGAWSSTIIDDGGTRATATWTGIIPSTGSSAGEYTVNIFLETNHTGADRTATITITSDGDDIPITVTQKGITASGEKPMLPVAVTGVAFNRISITMMENGMEELYALITPDNATNHGVTWSTSNPAVVSVNAYGQYGQITAHTPGTATITVKTADGDKTASCPVTVERGSVVIAGLEWAKRNIDTPGVFVNRAEDFGSTYT